ncbi:hypothetical protein B0H19DRAFT_1080218 [Mycena capillaripes]|nr:hypothetical protein B0H19DRAFT_1080218 [Mycena capillaripes]
MSSDVGSEPAAARRVLICSFSNVPRQPSAPSLHEITTSILTPRNCAAIYICCFWVLIITPPHRTREENISSLEQRQHRCFQYYFGSFIRSSLRVAALDTHFLLSFPLPSTLATKIEATSSALVVIMYSETPGKARKLEVNQGKLG